MQTQRLEADPEIGGKHRDWRQTQRLEADTEFQASELLCFALLCCSMDLFKNIVEKKSPPLFL